MMTTIENIDLTSKTQVREFVRLPFRLYAGHPQWCPPLLIDAEMYLNPQKHPFYEHSEAAFFIARKAGRVVGRIAALENKPFNCYHQTRQAQFYFFDCIDDLEVARALIEAASHWARQRGLTHLVGPKGFGPLDGYGLLVEGFEHRQMMTMMNYNHPYYCRLLEQLGFTKEVDFVSHYLSAEKFHLPERIHRIAERIQERGTLQVKRFRSKKELKAWVGRIGEAYNKAFVNNWEYYPLTQREIDFVVGNILMVADPRLIKAILHEDEVVGFLFAFPDVTSALQRANGKLFPFGLPDLLMEMRRTRWVALNGAGILKEHQGRGGNALLYAEMEKTIREFNFLHADLTQVAETASQMRNDLENIGGAAYKNHRVYQLGIE